MNDNEIIKALEDTLRRIKGAEHLIVPKQGVENLCNGLENALSLINRQKAELDDLKRDDLPRCKDALRRANEIGVDLEKENKELKAEVEKWELLNSILLESCNGYSKACDTYKAEIERLQEHNNTLIGRVDNLVYECDCEKQEASKEFAERLKAMFGEWLYGHRIDILVKEMVGDDK